MASVGAPLAVHSADKWRQAFMENEILLVSALCFDLKAASVLADRAGLLDGPLSLLLKEANLTKAHKVQAILAKLEDCGAGGYAKFLSTLSSSKQSPAYTEVVKRITTSMHRILPHCPNAAAEGTAMLGFLPSFAVGSGSADLQAAASKSPCCPRVMPSIPVCGCDHTHKTDEQTECLCCTIHFEECYTVAGNNTEPQGVVFGPGLIKPSGVLLRKSYRVMYTTLFKTAWNGQDAKANTMVTDILSRNIATDLKVISLEVIHTVDWKSDLQKLEWALAMSQNGTCENTSILTCRILRRLAGLHYRARNLQVASDYNQQALHLAEGIMPDIDTIYTYRLQALLLFEQFKETKEESVRKGMYEMFNFPCLTVHFVWVDNIP